MSSLRARLAVLPRGAAVNGQPRWLRRQSCCTKTCWTIQSAAERRCIEPFGELQPSARGRLRAADPLRDRAIQPAVTRTFLGPKPAERPLTKSRQRGAAGCRSLAGSSRSACGDTHFARVEARGTDVSHGPPGGGCGLPTSATSSLSGPKQRTAQVTCVICSG